MNHPDHPDTVADSQSEFISAMFISLVIQQTNMASIFLGLAPHPQTGQVAQELDHAKYFIDQLEMLEAKTKGNLDKREEGLLKQSLTNLRLAFVEAASHPPASPPAAGQDAAPPAAAAAPGEQSAPAASAAAPDPASAPEAANAVPPVAEDSKKKFTKKY
jgi:hypothetical protein